MARSKWKFNYFDNSIWKLILTKDYSVRKLPEYSQDHFKTYSRSSKVPKCLGKYTFYVHNGRSFISLEVDRSNVNSKFGEYAYTRKIFYYPMRKKIKPRK